MHLPGQAYNPLKDELDSGCEAPLLGLLQVTGQLLVLVLAYRSFVKILLQLRQVLSLVIFTRSLLLCRSLIGLLLLLLLDRSGLLRHHLGHGSY